MVARRLACVLTAGLLAASCSLANRISDDSVDYNLALENAANRSILSNVLRAKDRKRLHFTALSQIRGQLKFQAETSTSATIPFGGGSDDKYVLSPSAGVTYSTSPSFDVAVLDSQKFMRGILSPVKMEVFDHYWEQGWPREILLHMFIHRIEFSKNIEIDSKVYSSVNNFTGSKHRMETFQKFIRWLLVKGLRPGRLKTVTKIGPAFAGSTINLEQLVKAAEQKLSVSQVGRTANYQLERKSSSVVFCISSELETARANRRKSYGEASDVINLENRTCKATSDSDSDQEGITSLGISFGQEYSETVKLPGGQSVLVKIPNDTKFAFYIRSIEAMIYYLGEITRTLEEKDREVQIFVNRKPASLFTLMKKEPPEGFSLQVAYDGSIYGMARRKAEVDRSMHVLSLVGQLLALNKSADEIPSTQAVTVVGP